MKAVVVREFGAPDVMKVETSSDPRPGAAQVLIHVKAVGVNPVETYIRSGSYARKPGLPYTPGSDLAGVVEAVGANITAFKPGDRVYAHGVAAGSGAYAELAVSEDSQVHRLPDGVSFEQGAAIGVPYGTAWRALFHKAHARAGEMVFINGASGGVGTAAVQIARFSGLHVIGTAGTERGLALVLEQGAHHVLNHRDADYIQQVMPLTGGRGADVILEMLANVNLDRDLDILALRGRVVVVGNRGRVEIDPRKLMGKDSAIIGMVGPNATPEEVRETHAALGAALETGALKPVVGRTMPLGDAAKAHVAVMEPGAYGKIVLIP
jgi:NADPH2:quinone reductase